MAYLQKMHAEILDPALNEKKNNKNKNKSNEEEDD
jgi:hypothetical protein